MHIITKEVGSDIKGQYMISKGEIFTCCLQFSYLFIILCQT